MALDRNKYLGFEPLLNFSMFATQYKRLCLEMAQELGVEQNINEQQLKSAHDEWLWSYYDLVDRRSSVRRRITIVLSSLIMDLIRFKVVSYTFVPTLVPSHLAAIARKFPNEMTALAFVAVIYSIEIERKTGQDPSCTLAPSQVARAAGKLRLDSSSAIGFRRLLNLKRPKGFASVDIP